MLLRIDSNVEDGSISMNPKSKESPSDLRIAPARRCVSGFNILFMLTKPPVSPDSTPM